MSCIGINYNFIRGFKDQAIYYVICKNTYKIENYKSGVRDWIVKMGTICIYIMPKYPNCQQNHKVTTFKYMIGLKA